MSTISRTYTFTDGTTAYGSQVETEISTIVTAFNNHDAATSSWTNLKVAGASYFADGTVSLPGITFTSDVNTGVYRYAADVVAVTAGGASVMRWSGTQTIFTAGTSSSSPGLRMSEVGSVGFYRPTGLDMMGVSAPIGAADGTVSLPSYSFASDPDTGIYVVGANDIGFSAGGVGSYSFNAYGDFRPVANGITTTATGGFFFIQSCAGTPTGVPTDSSNRTPIVYDRTGNKIWVYDGGWIGVVVA